MNKLALIFPSSYFNLKSVDEALQYEYDSAIETELFNIILFSYEKWLEEHRLILSHKTESPVKAVYRGWMMKPEQYKEFYSGLYDNNIQLITSPDEYEKFHIFPNIYHTFGDDTAKMLVYPNGEIDLNEVKSTFEKFMIKDFVKSVKGTDFPKYFVNTVTEEEFTRCMELFYKYRGGLLTGGICVKEYLELKKYGGYTNEFRVFYIGGKAGTLSRNSCQGSFVPFPPEELVNKYENLGSPFYTVDFAELSCGEWKVIEAGDGQVSGLSPEQDYKAFFRTLSFML